VIRASSHGDEAKGVSGCTRDEKNGNGADSDQGQSADAPHVPPPHFGLAMQSTALVRALTSNARNFTPKRGGG
jgi:hypothetical protein